MMTDVDLLALSHDYQKVEKAIRFLEDRFLDQPDLDEIAASVHLSKYHFHRLFKRWAGVTPLQFLHYLTVDYAKGRLKESRSVLDTTLDAGLASPSRLHDLFVTFEAMTPGEYKKEGAGLKISYGCHPTPFGECLLALTPRGICALRFTMPGEREGSLVHLKGEWPRAEFAELPETTGPVAVRLFGAVGGDDRKGFRVLLKGTNFQVQVWRALLAVPPGSMVSYGDLAACLSSPGASRAVARAVSGNPIAYLIPCHRVITTAGRSHDYRWGRHRKKAMLAWEASRLHMNL
jgi:AraC family transcriptional regulator of adaptative response/methylated-DNA-[protein]-cysteine methyltransferase